MAIQLQSAVTETVIASKPCLVIPNKRKITILAAEAAPLLKQSSFQLRRIGFKGLTNAPVLPPRPSVNWKPQLYGLALHPAFECATGWWHGVCDMESGGTVDGFLIGANVLLTFSRPVCGGIGALGAVRNSVTYSGSARTSTAGFQTVNVTSFTNGAIAYPPAAPAKPSAYPLTAGKITQLNYSPESGAIDGFVFTPVTGRKVFVDVGNPGTTLAPLLTVGAPISVIGTLEAPGAGAPTGTILEVDASSLTIGSTAYPIGGNR